MTEYTIPISTAYIIPDSDTYNPIYMETLINGDIEADLFDAILYTGGGAPSIQELYDEGYLPNIIGITANEVGNSCSRIGDTFSGSLTNLALKDDNGDYNKYSIVSFPSQSEIVYRDGLSVWSKIASLGHDATTDYVIYNGSKVFKIYSNTPSQVEAVSYSPNSVRAELDPNTIVIFYWEDQFNIVEGSTYRLNLDYEIHSGEMSDSNISNVQIGGFTSTIGQPIPPLDSGMEWWLYYEDGGRTPDGVQTLEKSFTGTGTSSGEPDLDLDDDPGSLNHTGITITARSQNGDSLDIEFKNISLVSIEVPSNMIHSSLVNWASHTYSSHSFTELNTSSVSWTEV